MDNLSEGYLAGREDALREVRDAFWEIPVEDLMKKAPEITLWFEKGGRFEVGEE